MLAILHELAVIVKEQKNDTRQKQNKQHTDQDENKQLKHLQAHKHTAQNKKLSLF